MFAPAGAEEVKSVFCGDMCLGENASQAVPAACIPLERGAKHTSFDSRPGRAIRPAPDGKQKGKGGKSYALRNRMSMVATSARVALSVGASRLPGLPVMMPSPTAQAIPSAAQEWTDALSP